MHKHFWDSIEVHIDSKRGVTINLSPVKHILVGHKNTDNFVPINVIILAVKTYIFPSSRLSKILNIMEL